MFIDFYRKIKKEKIRNKNPKRTSIIAQFKKSLNDKERYFLNSYQAAFKKI